MEICVLFLYIWKTLWPGKNTRCHYKESTRMTELGYTGHTIKMWHVQRVEAPPSVYVCKNHNYTCTYYYTSISLFMNKCIIVWN